MKKVSLTLVMLLVLVSTIDAVATERDPFTGQPRVPTTIVPLIDRDDANVLWDLTHGVEGNYSPSGRFSNITSILANAGFIITTTDAGVDNIDLSTFDVVVICLGSAWESAYTYDEVAALLDFEGAGGGILVMSDNDGCPNENLDLLLSSFGVSTGLSTVQPLDLFLADFISHPIFNGIESLYLRAAGELGIISPAIEAGWAGAGEPLIGLVEDCRLVVVGDINFVDNTYMQEDNELFFLNIIGCLAEPGSVATEKTTLEGLKALYRDATR